VENTFKKHHWKNIQDALKALPGPTIFDEKLQINSETKRNIVLIYMIGGVTFGEIAAFRFLGKKYSNFLLILLGKKGFSIDKEILIATTHVLNGNGMIASLNERFDLEKE